MRVAAVLTALVLCAALAGPATPAGAEATPLPAGAILRLGGDDRYATAVAVSRASFAPGVPVAFVASGLGFPDALAAGAVAGLYRAPVLLVPPDGVPDLVAQELLRLGPAQIAVLGGPAAIADPVLTQLHALTSGGVDRFAGPDRYATAARVALAAFAGRDYGRVVFVASGTNYPDALAGAAAAGASAGPVLLTAPDSLPADTLDALATLAPTQVVLLGGPAAIAPGVQTELAGLGYSIVRLAGTDRYDTSAVVAAAIFRDPDPTTVYVAVGSNFPDALGGAPSAIVNGAPLLLGSRTCLPAASYRRLQAYRPAKVVLLGGPDVIGTTALTTSC